MDKGTKLRQHHGASEKLIVVHHCWSIKYKASLRSDDFIKYQPGRCKACVPNEGIWP